MSPDLLPSIRNVADHVKRAALRIAALRRDLRWEAGLDAEGTWMHRIVSPWEPDPEKPENAYANRSGSMTDQGKPKVCPICMGAPGFHLNACPRAPWNSPASTRGKRSA